MKNAEELSQDLIEREWPRTPEAIQKLVVQLNSVVENLQEVVTCSQRQVQIKEQEIVSERASRKDFLSQCSKIASHKPRQINTVVFVSDHPSTRHAKLAYGLKKIGWSVILLHKGTPQFDVKTYFAESKQYSSADEAVLLASLYSPMVYHVFASWNFETARKIIEHRPGKIIFESYDLFAGNLQPQFAEGRVQDLEDERFCLENADAISDRTLQYRHLDKLGYKVSKHAIFFPDYCWDKFEETQTNEAFRSKDELHIVFVGNFFVEDFLDDNSPSQCNKAFIEKITSTGCHYHLYPMPRPETEKEFAAYFQYAKENPRFHMHFPVPPERLIEELSYYHLGMFSYSKEALKSGDKVYTKKYLKYLTSNKVFDYLDAGLGVLISCSRFFDHMMCSHGVGIHAFKEDYPAVLENLTPEFCKDHFFERAAVARRKFSVWRNAPRLAAFYQEVLGAENITYAFDRACTR